MCVNIAKECTHMPKMVVGSLKKRKASANNSSESENQIKKQKAKIPQHRRGSEEDATRMSRGH